ncbi:lipid A deacylase LpxR family protein [Sulfurimonas sp.]|uniref:lipid A deacylase LpxR family protein n=1 Tax=Sulfurimonas sp. TaxID=2022749 RepID=UPI003D119B5E
MLKKTLLLIIFIVSLYAESFEIKNITFVTENDADFREDNDYTYGSELSVLFYRKDINNSFLHIPFTDYKNQDNYISISYAQQIYTPFDLESPDIIVDDRPYAGFSYLKSGLYQSYNNNLKTLVLQIGIVGPSSKMRTVQKSIHSLVGSIDPLGWNHQIQDEFILQLNYSHKQYIEISKNIAVIPEYGVELGNASTKVYAIGLFRWGNYLPKDYGSCQIDNTNYNKIPLKAQTKYKNKLGYVLNLSLKTNLVIHDIFLDGNSFKNSHSVDKNSFVAEIGYGFSINYGKFSIDYLRKHLSHQFKTQDRFHSYGSLIFSYNF